MPEFTQDQIDRILKAITEHAPDGGTCPMCLKNDWAVLPGIVVLTLQDDPKFLRVTGRSLPNFVLVCSQCGNTLLMNVFVLGLEDMFGLTSHKQKQRDQAEAIRTAGSNA